MSETPLPQDEARRITFMLDGRTVLEFVSMQDGAFHVRVPPGVEMTAAARDFVEVLKHQIPMLKLICGPHAGNG